MTTPASFSRSRAAAASSGDAFSTRIAVALNSAVHSYLILAYAQGDKVAMNVGFYYMANAGGRLVGTLLSGIMFQSYGVIGCLWASVVFAAAAGCFSLYLPHKDSPMLMADMKAEGAD